MAGKLDIPKFVDFRNKVKRHPTRRFPVLSLKGKTTIAIHHSLTRRGLGGSNAEGYARYHVDTHGWPSIGYHYVIEPEGTIKWCNDIELRTYHVGNHNNYAVGICLTGDFRYEEPTEAQKESLRNLVNALQKKYPHLKYIKGHNEFSGYEWKQCPVFDYKAVLAEKGTAKKSTELPTTYTIQEGDTLWSIAQGFRDLSVDDLLKANPGIEPTKLQIGQKINLGNARRTATKKQNPDERINVTVDGLWGPQTTKALQKHFKTPIDGVISGQPKNRSTQNIPSVKYGTSGSMLIRAMQRHYGTIVDGIISGKSQLITAMQKKYGLRIVDGYVSKPSNLVKEIQRRLNNGTL